MSDEDFNGLLATLSLLLKKETSFDVNTLVKETQSLSGVGETLVLLFLSEYGKVLHLFNLGNTPLQCALDQEIWAMYRSKRLSLPNALDIASVHLAHGVNGEETTVNQSERTSKMAKGKIKISGQSEQDVGLDLKGVKLDFDTKTKP